MWERHLHRPTVADKPQQATPLVDSVFSKLPYHDLGPTQKPLVNKPPPQRKYYDEPEPPKERPAEDRRMPVLSAGGGSRPATASAMRSGSRPGTAKKPSFVLSFE